MRSETKKMLAYMLALVVSVTTLFHTTQTAVNAATLTNDGTDVTASAGNFTVTTDEKGQTVYNLQGNVYDGITITLSEGETAVLDGKGYSVNGKASSAEPVPALTVKGNGTLVLQNVHFLGGEGAYDRREQGSTAVVVDSEAVNLIVRDEVEMRGGSASCAISEGAVRPDGTAEPSSVSWLNTGGSGIVFRGSSLMIEEDAEFTFAGGQGITDGAGFSYAGGLVSNETMLEKVVKEENVVSICLHYPEEVQTWYMQKNTKLNMDYLPKIIVENHFLEGWLLDETEDTLLDTEAGFTVSENQVYYAKYAWTPVTVVFDAEESESSIASQTLSYNGLVKKPSDPSRKGYTFDGWYTDKECRDAYDFTVPVTESMTLYAKWNRNSYQVVFDTKGGSMVTARMIDYNKTVTKPSDPVRNGYTFAGWYTDAACTSGYDFTTPIVENITLYAKWVPVSGKPGGTSPQPSEQGQENSQVNGKDDMQSGGKVTQDEYTVMLNATSIPLQKGKSTSKIKATLTEGDEIVSWKSSNKKVAVVNKTGVIKAKKVGKANITVTTKKGATATVKVKVQKGKVKTKSIVAANVSDKKLTMKKGSTFVLKTRVKPITTQEKTTFKTSDKKVVKVTKKGKLKALKEGSAQITVKSGKKKVKITVTVE